MRINIIHHHLHPGGVTRVMRSQIQALRQYYPNAAIRLIVGDATAPEAWEQLGITLEVNEIVNYLYDSEDITREFVKKRATELESYFTGLFEKAYDFLHVHNLNLGKNPAMTYAFYRLARRGYQVLNHAHDFSEDRPKNQEYLERLIGSYLGEDVQATMYPDLPNYCFGVLNSWDYKRLLQYGIDEARIFLLENPVVFDNDGGLPNYEESRQHVVKGLELDFAKKIITYPVRVIRRKNIGEFILLAALFADSAEWLVTQPPKNPEEQAEYRQWTEFCIKNTIHVHFDAGTQVDFEKLLVASDFCITTSRQEGFGMMYLEPWLMNTPVIGRDLPHITRDMKNKGIDLSSLYQALELKHNGAVKDFKDLDTGEQRKAIKKVLQDASAREALFFHNDFLAGLLEDIPLPLVKNNQQIIKQEYAYQKYADKLYGIYQGSIGKSG